MTIHSCITTYAHSCLKPLSNLLSPCSNHKIHMLFDMVFTYKNSAECYVTSAFHLHLKYSMKTSIWYIFGQNSCGCSWDIVCFIFFAIFSNGRCQPFWMVNLRKTGIAFLRIVLTQFLYETCSESLENCHFPVFAFFSISSHQSSWIAESHKFERTPFADHSD